MADRQSSMFLFIKRGKRKVETDENKENYRPNKSTKVDHHKESSKKPSKQRTRLFYLPEVQHKSKEQIRNLGWQAMYP